MNILDRLTQLRTETKGCALVALADISTGIVLCSDTIIKMPQERVDILAKTAARLFQQASVQGDMAAEVFAVNPQNAQIFLRSVIDENEVLCAVCTPDTNTAEFLTQARQAFADISGAT